MPIQLLLGLILCNLIWSAHPAMGKLLLADTSPAIGAWLRYSSALGAYLLAILILKFSPRIRSRLKGPFFLLPDRPKDWMLVAGVGFMAFCFAPLFQMTGLHASRATDNALIIAMEPLMTVFLAYVFLREKLASGHWIAFGMALAGFALLTGMTPDRMTFEGHLLGNLLMLIALTGEASYSVLGRKLLEKYPPVGVFGTALVIGVLFLTLGTWMVAGNTIFELPSLSWKSVLGLLWLGPIGTALAYLFWMMVLRQASVASLALTLFIQPVFGSLWGFIFLGERLSEVQSAGALLIIAAVLAQSFLERMAEKSRTVSKPAASAMPISE